MTHEFSDAAASRDRRRLQNKGESRKGLEGPSALLDRVLANSALRGAQGMLLKGGQDGQLSLGDAPDALLDQAQGE